MMGRLVALGFAAVLLVATSGCGSDDDGADTLTKQEWIVAADSICVALNEELEPIPEPQSAEEIAETGAEVAEISRTRLSELRASRTSTASAEARSISAQVPCVIITRPGSRDRGLVPSLTGPGVAG